YQNARHRRPSFDGREGPPVVSGLRSQPRVHRNLSNAYGSIPAHGNAGPALCKMAAQPDHPTSDARAKSTNLSSVPLDSVSRPNYKNRDSVGRPIKSSAFRLGTFGASPLVGCAGARSGSAFTPSTQRARTVRHSTLWVIPTVVACAEPFVVVNK